MDDGVVFRHRGYSARHWKASDRETAAGVVKHCLEAYGLEFEPEGADLDAVEVEARYKRGEFWVVIEEGTNELIGTGAYYEIEEGSRCVEIRKMYLLPSARGKQLGRALLQHLEEAIASKGYQRIFIETAYVLHEACRLYESAGYLPVGGVETERCTGAGYLPVGGVETERCDYKLYKDTANSKF